MKGVSPIVWIIIVIIVMLVVALVVMSLFGGGVTQVGTFAEAKSICISHYTSTCMATGQPPATWSMPTVRVGTETVTCASQAACSCEDKVASCS